MTSVVAVPSSVLLRGVTYTFTVGSSAILLINAASSVKKPQTKVRFKTVARARASVKKPQTKVTFKVVASAIAKVARPSTKASLAYRSYRVNQITYAASPISLRQNETYEFTTPEVSFLVASGSVARARTKAVLYFPIKINTKASVKQVQTKTSIRVPFAFRHLSGPARPKTAISIFIPPFEVYGRSTTNRAQTTGVILVPNIILESPGVRAPRARMMATAAITFNVEGSLRPRMPVIRAALGWTNTVYANLRAPLPRATGELDVKYTAAGHLSAPRPKVSGSIYVDLSLHIEAIHLKAPMPRFRGALSNVVIARRRTITIIQ